jgi:hypothetical protein
MVNLVNRLMIVPRILRVQVVKLRLIEMRLVRDRLNWIDLLLAIPSLAVLAYCILHSI